MPYNKPLQFLDRSHHCMGELFFGAWLGTLQKASAVLSSLIYCVRLPTPHICGPACLTTSLVSMHHGVPLSDAPVCRFARAVGGLQEKDRGEPLLDGSCSVLCTSPNWYRLFNLVKPIRRVRSALRPWKQGRYCHFWSQDFPSTFWCRWCRS
jgi:hypothetical protein